jgi:hypothetical protein
MRNPLMRFIGSALFVCMTLVYSPASVLAGCPPRGDCTQEQTFCIENDGGFWTDGCTYLSCGGCIWWCQYPNQLASADCYW